jgi:hypothetical protein
MTFLSLWRHAPIRRDDFELVAVETGYWWDQDRLQDLASTGVWTVAGAVFAVIGLLKGELVAFALALAVAALTGGYLCAILSRPRIVIFKRDGAILTPNGIPRRILPVRKLWFPHARIASIELTGDCQNFGVMLFTIDGESVLLAENMHKADARLVAVQLTRALLEMRDGLANARPPRMAYDDNPWPR